jgi:tetratricopeptide (TPR) repeat protein/transcriptional regulator with XRE-family HTH domain
MTPASTPGFGALLKRYRNAAGITQEELAMRAGLSVEAISALERGTRQAPRKETIQLLIEALHLSEADGAVLQNAARRRLTSSPVSGTLSLSPEGAAVPFVGRAREVALAQRMLSAAGQPALLLAGEPGIGKTRLLREAAAQAASQGWTVLQGGCYPHGGQEPYAPVLEALQSRIRGQSPAQLRKDLERCAWLSVLLPELADVVPAPAALATAQPDQQRRLLFNAVGTFLTNIAGPSGILLVLDDLQWAGADALDLLAALVQSARSSEQTRVRVAGAYRDVEVTPQHPLSGMIAQLARGGLLAQARVAPLTGEEAAKLLDVLLGEGQGAEEAVAERVLARAGGVPFFLVSCAQGLNVGALDSTGAEGVPWDVAETVRQRVGALPEAARELLATAAVADRRVARAVVIAVASRAGRDEREVLLALDVACHARLLVEEGDDAYAFAHGLVREVVWSDLGAARRAALHRRVAEAVERQPGTPPAEALAYHYMRCGEREKAAIYLERAGDRAREMHANTAAEEFYRDLIDQLDALGRLGDAARAREKLGAVLRVVARYDEALTILRQAADGFRAANDLEGRRQAVAQLGRVHARRGTPQEGISAIEGLLKATGEQEATLGLAALYVALAELYSTSGRYREQLSAATRAAELARGLSQADAILLAQAEHWRSTALLTLGRAEEALPALHEVIPLAEAAGDLSSHAQALNHVAQAHINRGEFAKGRDYVERALAVAERRGDPAQTAFMTYNRGEVAAYLGDWKQARADFERAAAAMRQIGMVWASAYPALGLGHLCLVEGQFGQAARYLQEAVVQAERMGDIQALRQAQIPLIERDLLEERPEVADARLSRLMESGRSMMLEGASYLMTLLAWLAVEQGELEKATMLVEESLTRAEAEQHQLARVSALVIRARLEARQGHWPEAEAAATQALDLSRAMPYPYGEARALYTLGMHLAQMGQAASARKRLDEALGMLHQLGERLYAQRIEQTLKTLPR